MKTCPLKLARRAMEIKELAGGVPVGQLQIRAFFQHVMEETAL